MEKWIPKGKQTKFKAEMGTFKAAAAENSKLLKAFCGDAQKAITHLREAAASGDIKLFTITAHGMKSALANIGENAASGTALALEKAGQSGDMDFISANTESFIHTLEALIERHAPALKALTPPKPLEDGSANAAADRAYFTDQLAIIKKACDNYDSKAAYDAIDRLQEKPQKADTAAALEQIRDMLFLHSDFEEAANLAQTLLES